MKQISLDGTWSCRLDAGRQGRAEHWQHGTVAECAVSLPGTTQTNGIGPAYSTNEIGNLTPITDYVGPVWYWRDIELSAEDCNQIVELSLDRCSWETFVWLNGTSLGTRDSLVSPHVYDLSSAATPGTNRLTIMVYNSNLKSASSNAATEMAEDEELIMLEKSETRLKCGGHHALFLGFCWNGITGELMLSIRPRVRISKPQIYPDVAQKRISVIGGRSGASASQYRDGNGNKPATLE